MHVYWIMNNNKLAFLWLLSLQFSKGIILISLRFLKLKKNINITRKQRLFYIQIKRYKRLNSWKRKIKLIQIFPNIVKKYTIVCFFFLFEHAWFCNCFVLFCYHLKTYGTRKITKAHKIVFTILFFFKAL